MPWWHPLAYGGVALVNAMIFIVLGSWIYAKRGDGPIESILGHLVITLLLVWWACWFIWFPVNWIGGAA